jgi:HD-GYP domain-containing protein (c-di-GMP phosphodiesterase class II)
MDQQSTLVEFGNTRSGLVEAAEQDNWNVVRSGDEKLAETAIRSVALIVSNGEVSEGIRSQYPQALILSETPCEHADMCITSSVDNATTHHLLKHAHAYWRQNLKVTKLVREVGVRRERMHQLSEIGIALSARMGFDELLRTILSEARRIASCEAGSLYLLAEEDEQRRLGFKLAQNDAIDVPFVEAHLPLTSESVAGYVAISGEELNIEDVYNLSPDLPYSFNRSFDEQFGYRSQSMLVLPMRNDRHEVVGVLQFLNRLSHSEHGTREGVIPFSEEVAELLRAIASQAAVSIQKNNLITNIHNLFESFVHASVKTIERRDPTTSGHSFRVADTTVKLLTDLPRSGNKRFRDLRFSEENVREVRYAALLHDFGKVAVRENVLTKPRKLSDDRVEVIRYRVELQKEKLRRKALERELELMHKGEDPMLALKQVHREMARDMGQLDDYLEWVLKANEPNVLEEGDFEHLRMVRDAVFGGDQAGLLNEEELLALSVRRGSLTQEERLEIENHVVQTREFLDGLPWPKELARVPEIAGAHHEKLDGSGYPLGLTDKEIPLPSKVMTVCDIFDALTAMDRPYKSAMPDERAFFILEDEASRGLLDTEIVTVFVQSRSSAKVARTG